MKQIEVKFGYWNKDHYDYEEPKQMVIDDLNDYLIENLKYVTEATPGHHYFEKNGEKWCIHFEVPSIHLESRE